MTRRTASAAFHQFGNILLALAAVSFIALPLGSLAHSLLS